MTVSTLASAGPSAPPPPRRALLSAHRAAAQQTGTRPHTWASLHAAVRLPVDFVELDVHRTACGDLVLQHDRHLRVRGAREAIHALRAGDVERALGRELVRYDDALALLAAHGKRAHIDLKFLSEHHHYPRPGQRAGAGIDGTWEVRAARTALETMGVGDRFVLTTMEDCSVHVLREWADAECPDALVGLSLGRDSASLDLGYQARLRWSELFPGRRIEACRASLVVAHHRLADANLLRWSANRGLPVLVWTVDGRRQLTRLLADPRVWMVTSNRPARADHPAYA